MNFPEINIAGEGKLHANLNTSLGKIVVRLEEERTPTPLKTLLV